MREASAVKNLLHETLRKKLNKLADEAKVRFLSLNAFPTSTWEDADWLYEGKVKIIFVVKGEQNVELELLNKVFIEGVLKFV